MCVGVCVCVFDPIYSGASLRLSVTYQPGFKKKKNEHNVMTCFVTNHCRAVLHDDEELPISIPATIPTAVV